MTSNGNANETNETVFSQVKNEVTGKPEWIMNNSHYDYSQEIARSSYADMLHDNERNEKYYAALKKVVEKFRSSNRPVHVLDIGTGSGLLSLMAAKLGADSVTACEVFKPMLKCARDVISQNKFSDKINLVPKRSTEIKVGVDMAQKANILITEVFDTELIGEGAIGTFNHAHEYLLEEECEVIPHGATMFIQVVQSKNIRKWHQLFFPRKPDLSESHVLSSPPEFYNCPGRPSIHDLQLKQIHPSNFTTITEPLTAFKFDFSKGNLARCRSRTIICEPDSAVSQRQPYLDAIFMWWSLQMDREGQIVLSCAPPSSHPDGSAAPWRDHWMQAIFYPSQSLRLGNDDNVQVHCNHDEYSLWFDAKPSSMRATNGIVDSDPANQPCAGPSCVCGLHMALSRSRIRMLSDKSYLPTFHKFIAAGPISKLPSPANIAFLGDANVLSVITSLLYPQSRCFSFESNRFCREFLTKLARHNGVKAIGSSFDVDNDVSLNILSDEPSEDLKIPASLDAIIAEPWYVAQTLPWFGLRAWYETHELLKALTPLIGDAPKPLISPVHMRLCAIAIEFEDLWKIRSPVKSKCGFEMSALDSLVQPHIGNVDCPLEAQPLWEYPGVALTSPHTLLEIDLRKSPVELDDGKALQTNTLIEFDCPGSCNGIAVWADWVLDDQANHIVSTGVSRPVKQGLKIEWTPFHQQGVILLPKPESITPGRKCLALTTSLNVSSGSLSVRHAFSTCSQDSSCTCRRCAPPSCCVVEPPNDATTPPDQADCNRLSSPVSTNNNRNPTLCHVHSCPGGEDSSSSDFSASVLSSGALLRDNHATNTPKDGVSML